MVDGEGNQGRDSHGWIMGMSCKLGITLRGVDLERGIVRDGCLKAGTTTRARLHNAKSYGFEFVPGECTFVQNIDTLGDQAEIWRSDIGR